MRSRERNIWIKEGVLMPLILDQKVEMSEGEKKGEKVCEKGSKKELSNWHREWSFVEASACRLVWGNTRPCQCYTWALSNTCTTY